MKLKPLATILMAGSLSISAAFLDTRLVGGQEAEQAAPIDVAGVYQLMTVNAARLPAAVLHGTTNITVNSGTFTITADGTCASMTKFVVPSGAEIKREVNAKYTQDGDELRMQWEGFGTTIGKVKGDVFKMDNEGMIFEYRRQATKPSRETRALSDQQQVLDRFLGKWRSVDPTGKDPETELSYQRVLGGNYVEERGERADGKSAILMYTYDTDRECYRLWSFRSWAKSSEAIGCWDESTKTLTWTSVDSDDELSTVVTHRFVDDQRMHWDAVGKDANGQVVFRTEGQATRVESR